MVISIDRQKQIRIFMEINAFVIVPQQIVEILRNLMQPLYCCPNKKGLEMESVYIYDQKGYCEPCLKKVADELERTTEQQ